MKDAIYTLNHIYGNPPRIATQKFIGAYSTRADAEAAQARAVTWEGFSKYPDGFVIEEYLIDQDHRTDGFTVPGKSPQ
jgi:hypothetical protein